MWYNSKTNELQSNPPWSGYLHPDVIAEQYADWQQVSDDFIPPVPEPTKQQKIDQLNSYYPQRLSGILEAIQQATALGNSTTELIAKYQATFAEYKTKMAELVGA